MDLKYIYQVKLNFLNFQIKSLVLEKQTSFKNFLQIYVVQGSCLPQIKFEDTVFCIVENKCFKALFFVMQHSCKID